MRIHEQRDRLIDAVRAAEAELHAMRSAVLRKTLAPYGDGSRSDLVNANTDVVPRLQAVLDLLTVATDDIGNPERRNAMPWWNCAAVALDGDDEIDLDIDVRAATAGEAEDIARAEWADHGLGADAVKTRRLDPERADA